MILSGRLGWEDLAKRVSEVYHALPEQDRENCGILCMNYGELGALEYYSDAYDLPQAISGHLSCYYWGWGNYDGKCLIIAGMNNVSKRLLEFTFDYVTATKGPRNKYASYYENDVPIYICRGLKIPLDDFWEAVRCV